MLTVLQVAYPLAPVSLDATGGAEQVLALLDRALVTNGHRSITIACTGSHTRGHLLEVPLRQAFDEQSQRLTREAVRTRILESLAKWNVDVVHMHGVDFYKYLPPPGPPVLATLHLPATYYTGAVFSISRPDTYLNCVSEAQRRSCPPCHSLVATIENGVPLDLFPERLSQKEDYVLVVGRICPEKGFHLALEAAERAGVPLWIAGQVFPYAEHEQYFRRELLPRVKPPHRFLGPVGFTEKVRLLAAARCLIVSSLVPETSCLVAMEAMACGTPVISFDSGALGGLVNPGRTGFLCRSVDELANGIARSNEIRGSECRLEARNRFSVERMADRYVSLYREIASGGLRRPKSA